jgi:hypothetical protein
MHFIARDALLAESHNFYLLAGMPTTAMLLRWYQRSIYRKDPRFIAKSDVYFCYNMFVVMTGGDGQMLDGNGQSSA